MARKTRSEDGTIVQWEERQGNKWAPKKHTFHTGLRLGAVLKEMRSQDNLRNITLAKE